MWIRTLLAWNKVLVLSAILGLPACKTFQNPKDGGAPDSGGPGSAGRGVPGGGGGGGTAGTGTGGIVGPQMDAADAPLDIVSMPPDTASGSGGSGGGTMSGCAAGTTRLCKDDPDHAALGNCGDGSEACVAGAWGPCSLQPAAKDSCAIQGDDATCNGQPNEGCPCVSGATQACGPAADVGLCKRGTQTCTNGAWGSCVGAVFAAPRDCTSAADNNCDGMPDNTLDAVCVCAKAATRACDEHPGKDGNGRCKPGTQTCVVAADNKTSDWGTCGGGVAPAAADTCAPGNDDNCNGMPNEGCACVTGNTQPCGPAANIGICKRGSQTCTGGTWGACTGAVSAAARNCTSSVDNDCNGTPDNADTSTCKCQMGATNPCPAGNDPQCVTGNETCMISADKSSSSWTIGTCAVKAGACGTAASCLNDVLKPAGTCGGSIGTVGSNGNASCNVPLANNCSNFHSCASPTACSSTCSGTTGCASGYYCAGANSCVPKKADGALCASNNECAHTCGGRCCAASQSCLCPQPTAQNLFINAGPGFDSSDFSLWGPSSAVEYAGDDADGCPFSGSIVKYGLTDNYGYPQACANVPAGGGPYTFGFSLKNPMQDIDVFYCAIFWWTGQNCTGEDDGDNFIVNSDVHIPNNFAPNWIPRSASFNAPATSPYDGKPINSLQMRCPDSMSPVYIDKVYLSPGFSGGY